MFHVLIKFKARYIYLKFQLNLSSWCSTALRSYKTHKHTPSTQTFALNVSTSVISTQISKWKDISLKMGTNSIISRVILKQKRERLICCRLYKQCKQCQERVISSKSFPLRAGRGELSRDVALLPRDRDWSGQSGHRASEMCISVIYSCSLQ